MPDVALSTASSPLAALLSGGMVDSQHGAAQRSEDPFAALLEQANGAKGQAPAKSGAPDPFAVDGKSATASKAAILLAGTAPVTSASPAAAAAIPATPTTAPLPDPVEPLPDESEATTAVPKGKSEDSDADSDDKDDGTDKLADAIASGPTAVLALAPAIVAPVVAHATAPAQTPAAVDAPTARKPLKLAAAMPTHTAFKTRIAGSEVPSPADQTATAHQLGADSDARAQQQPQPQIPAADDKLVQSELPPAIAKGAMTAIRQRDTGAVATTAPVPAAPTAQIAPAQAPAGEARAATPQTAAIATAEPATQPSAADADAKAATPPAAPVAIATTPLPRPADATSPAPAPLTLAAADPTVVPVASSVAPVTAKIQPQQQAQSLPAAVHQPQPQAAPAHGAPRPRRGDEAAAPRRAGEARRRSNTMPADAASTGLNQPAADSARATIGRPVGNVQGKGDTMVEQTLTIAKDGAWLDSLAKDIVNAGAGNDLHFKLNPENLGALSVAISQKDDGASIRLTADNQQTRDILVDAQPKLIAEARAQGLKVSDAQVDVRQDQNHSQNQSPNQDSQRWAQQQSGQNAMSQNGQNRQSSPGHKPFVSNLGRKANTESESSDGDSGSLYA